MTLPYDLAHVRRAPSMCLPAVTYDSAVAYIMGIDAATDHGFLLGFRQWIVLKADAMQVDFRNNFHWRANLLSLAVPSHGNYFEYLRNCSDHKPLIEFLFDRLEEFLDERGQMDGMRTIYLRYQEWLECQEWYDKDSPHWIEHRVGSTKPAED